MSRRTRGREPLQDRLTWQAASLLLAYPDAQQTERLDTVDALLGHLLDARGAALRRTAAALRERDFMSAQRDYVETFDLSRRHTLLLTFWTAGDTRNRGVQMLAFAQAYRAAGVEPPAAEAPDHLPVVLEFAATVDPQAGRRLLTEHRVPIDGAAPVTGRGRVCVRRCGGGGECHPAGRGPGRGHSADVRRTTVGSRWAAAIPADGAAAPRRGGGLTCRVGRSSGTRCPT